jgi:hypothetical protein
MIYQLIRLELIWILVTLVIGIFFVTSHLSKK